MSEYSELKQAVEEIKYYEEEKKLLNETYQKVISSHALLSSYSNVIQIMYQALKKLTKITSGTITCSWKVFLTIVD